MKKLIILFIFFTNILNSQDSSEIIKMRREKIQTILKLQDQRAINSGKLISFLADRDSIVREKATLAYGSIQDTSVLHLLIRNLDDPATCVKRAAVFSIGQTASMLSFKGKQNLEDQLIWKKLGSTGVDELLIEEIGKFGTEEALNQLMIRYGTLYPRIFVKALSMSIARFAIRGIYNQAAIDYLISFLKPDAKIEWQIMYALMRISSIPQTKNEILKEINNIATFYTYNNSYVRMYLATILGRLQAENYTIEPLLKLAEFDRDWRVRINAIKSLANFDFSKHPRIASVFKRAIYDENMHIALTAINELGKTNINEIQSNPITKDIFEYLWRILENPNKIYLWQYQANAAITLAKLKKAEVIDLIYKNFNSERRLKSYFIQALAITEQKQVSEFLLSNTMSDDPLVAINSLEGLQNVSKIYRDDQKLMDDIYKTLINSLGHRNQAVIATAALVLRDSLFLRKESVDPLIEALNRLRKPYDIDASVEIIRTLGNLRDKKAVKILRSQLTNPEKSVANAALDALKTITGEDYSKELLFQIQPLYVDYDFDYLEKFSKNPFLKIETMKGEIKLELFVDIAPFTVLNFIRLAEKGFFRGVAFHRIVPNFVIQAGDPEGTGWGGPGYTIRSEFSPVTFDAGCVGMASSGKDTEGSQFFITQSPQPHLDGKYTLFGRVISGMDVVNKIQIDDKILDVKLY